MKASPIPKDRKEISSMVSAAMDIHNQFQGSNTAQMALDVEALQLHKMNKE